MMAFRFQRSIRIAPGLRLNLSKSGLGFSAGPRGFKVGVNARGKRYASIGIPGTGIAYRTYEKTAPRPSVPQSGPISARSERVNLPGDRIAGTIAVLVVVGVLLYLIGLILTR